jgi:hypothetical protein
MRTPRISWPGSRSSVYKTDAAASGGGHNQRVPEGKLRLPGQTSRCPDRRVIHDCQRPGRQAARSSRISSFVARSTPERLPGERHEKLLQYLCAHPEPVFIRQLVYQSLRELLLRRAAFFERIHQHVGVDEAHITGAHADRRWSNSALRFRSGLSPSPFSILPELDPSGWIRSPEPSSIHAPGDLRLFVGRTRLCAPPQVYFLIARVTFVFALHIRAVARAPRS